MKILLLPLNRGLEAIALPILGLCLIVSFFVLSILPVAAAPLSVNDGNANYGCEWVKAENGNFLVLAKGCDGVPTITGGYTSKTETFTRERNGVSETVESTTFSESRGGRFDGERNRVID